MFGDGVLLAFCFEASVDLHQQEYHRASRDQWVMPNTAAVRLTALHVKLVTQDVLRDVQRSWLIEPAWRPQLEKPFEM